ALDCPYTLLEAAPAPGGNARTLRFGDFRYDTGPHRFHDRDPGATRRVVELLGDDLRAIEAPSRIFWNGAFVDFPLRPLQALTSGGAARSLAAMLGLLRARLRPARAWRRTASAPSSTSPTGGAGSSSRRRSPTRCL